MTTFAAAVGAESAVSGDDQAVVDPPILDRPLTLTSDVALRPEPFGALAYHYGTRRLVFLRDPALVTVVESLADHPHAAAALDAAGIAPYRRASFATALDGLAAAGVIAVRTSVDDSGAPPT